MPEFTKCIFKVSFEQTSSSAALNWPFSEKIKEHKKNHRQDFRIDLNENKIFLGTDDRNKKKRRFPECI